jgi:hypothetical protein
MRSVSTWGLLGIDEIVHINGKLVELVYVSSQTVTTNFAINSADKRAFFMI